MTEQQRLTWLLALPACAETNRAMQEMTDVLQYNSGEQNKDMTNARKQRDMKDTLTILTVLAERNPFASNPGFRNIMSGINAHSTVNVDTAKDTGKKILTSMTGQSATDYTFKRNAQAVTLVATSAIKIDNDLVQIDPQLLFQRLILACEGPDELAAVFRYELCSYPPALFDPSLMMRQPQKPVLADAIWAKLTPDAKTEPPSGAQYVLDGGALLHRVIWPQGSVTYKEICLLYCRYVSRKYGTPIIVFDGYEEESTKSMTLQGRANGKVGATVNFTAEMKVAMKKYVFLSNAKNKHQFIEMLATFLRNIDCQTRQAKGDADVLIVKTAVESASEKTTILVGDDTDLLVLLLYYTPSNSCDLFFKPEPKANSTKRRVWNIKKVQTQIGEDICWNILFIHAILGCDTTSRVHGFGKGASLKMYIMSLYFREQAQVFDSASATPEEIATAGHNVLVSLYKGKPGEQLDHLRYTRYCEKLACRTSQIQPQSLPPTSEAAKNHSLRVYLQVKQWKDEDGDMAVQDWRWKINEGQVTPVMTDLPAAPESLLRIVRCNCTKDCSSMTCRCRKHNLECSIACGQCKGSGCTNSAQQLLDSDDDSDE
ncbi:hypothetical protein QZH41_003875 [Actinostola sp. cb2023]|nr:hypothetical protein QZH41_003875 [Actinostola sp. cb2023]